MSIFLRYLTAVAALASSLLITAPASAQTCPPLLNHTVARLQDGTPQSLCQYHGKVILVVNTASYCGYTRQYDGLERIYQKYKDKGLVVLGFPSNDFGEQEPGAEKEIAEFCRSTYGIKFPMMAKTAIEAPKTHPFYKMLIEKSGARPEWNFHKYLIDRSGRTVTSFNTRVSPESDELVAALEKRLADSP